MVSSRDLPRANIERVPRTARGIRVVLSRGWSTSTRPQSPAASTSKLVPQRRLPPLTRDLARSREVPAILTHSYRDLDKLTL
ncbi:hypothetical protein RRG08_064616 [Elysia crispata]|uniref:Uncharacterized protein n=1 Tax=Elysia crispata TaxID=231223 RepID=A0AAE1ECM3_9GAST|nr:hypothetical protein RRG08_064616 [Elysia crispata]